MRLEVLVTTMHQEDFSKYELMNLQSDAVIANQTKFSGYFIQEINGHKVKLISTDLRGVSRNRNTAICLSEAELIMFADDDIVFYDGYEEKILREFHSHPEAEAIRFELHTTKRKEAAISEGEQQAIEKKRKPYRKAGRREVAGMGVCALVVKREVLIRHNMFFNEMYGPGKNLYCGEDTIFQQDMIKNRVKYYLSPLIIGDIDKSDSTWFTGYDKKHFYVSGRILGHIHPGLAWVLAIRSAYRYSKRDMCKYRFWEILRNYWKGIFDCNKLGY